MHTIFKGSHKPTETPLVHANEGNRVRVVLETGDALIWQGGLQFQCNNGAGGRVFVLVGGAVDVLTLR